MAWRYSRQMLRSDKRLLFQVMILCLLLGTSYYTLFMTGRLEVLLLNPGSLEKVVLPAFFDYFSSLYLLVSLLFFFLANFFLWFTVRQRILAKKSDIALMTALGHVWRIRWFIFSENIVSILLALLPALVGAFATAKAVQLFLARTLPFPLVLTIAYTTLFLLSAYFSAAYVTRSLLSKNFKDIRETGFASDSIVGLETDKESGAILNAFMIITSLFLRKTGLVTRKVAVKLMLRSFSLSKYYLILIIVLVFSITTIVSGSIVVRDTCHDHIKRAEGDDLYLVTFSDVAGFLLPLYDFTRTGISYHMGHQWIDASEFRNKLSSIPCIIDERIVVYTAIREVAARIITRDTESTLGLARRAEAVIQGINPESLTQSWYYKGFSPAELPLGKIIIGDWLAANLFTAPFRETLRIYRSSENREVYFQGQIASTVIDPLAGGKSVYTRVEDLEKLFQLEKGARNAFFVKLNSEQHVGMLENTVKELGMEVFSLEEKLTANREWIDKLWLLASLLVLPVLTVLVLSMLVLQERLFEEKKKDLGVMKAIGASKGVIISVIGLEIKIFVVFGVLTGTIAGLTVASSMLIDNAVLNPDTVIVSLIILFSVTALVFEAVKSSLNRKISLNQYSR
ncbi:MAG: FtsX-like permease family protein [Candidatus Odinarchaeota archaeon]